MTHPITTLFDQNSERPYLVHGKFPALFIERSHKKNSPQLMNKKPILLSLSQPLSTSSPSFRELLFLRVFYWHLEYGTLGTFL